MIYNKKFLAILAMIVLAVSIALFAVAINGETPTNNTPPAADPAAAKGKLNEIEKGRLQLALANQQKNSEEKDKLEAQQKVNAYEAKELESITDQAISEICKAHGLERAECLFAQDLSEVKQRPGAKVIKSEAKPAAKAEPFPARTAQAKKVTNAETDPLRIDRSQRRGRRRQSL